MSESTLKQKTAKGFFWGGIGNGIQQILGVCIGIILLKNLTPDDYGMVGLLAIFIPVASAIQESGFTIALTNRPDFKHEDYNSVFWFSFVVSIGIYLLLFLCAPLIARFFKQPELIPLSRFLFLSFVISSLTIAHNALLYKRIMAIERAKSDVFSTLIGGSIGIYMALNNYGYWSLAVQTVISALVKTLFQWYYSKWNPSFSFNFQPIKEMLGFGSKLLVATLIGFIQSNIFSVILGRFYSKTEVGYYSQGMKWANMCTQVITTGMISSVAQPIFIQIVNDNERLIQVFRKILRFISLISFPVLFGTAFIGREFIQLINEDWLPCVPILQLYCIWGAFMPFSSLYMQLALSNGHSKLYFFHSIAYAICQIGIAFLMIPYGFYWMAFAVIIVSFLFLLIWQLLIQTFISIKFIHVLKDILPYLLITLFSIAITYLITIKVESILLLLTLKILIVAFIYILIMWKSNSIIFRESIDLILKRIKKD